MTKKLIYKICLVYLEMEDIVSLGTVSSRGQIAVPASIRKEMELKEGQKVLFLLEEGVLLMKKVTTQTFAQITQPLRIAKKKISEKDVPALIHKLRKKWK